MRCAWRVTWAPGHFVDCPNEAEEGGAYCLKHGGEIVRQKAQEKLARAEKAVVEAAVIWDKTGFSDAFRECDLNIAVRNLLAAKAALEEQK